MQVAEPSTIGLSAEAHNILKRLKDEHVFRELRDAYRFAIAFGVASGQQIVVEESRTIFNVHTVDPDRAIYWAMRATCSNWSGPMYGLAERYAEWGVRQLGQLLDRGYIDFTKILRDNCEPLPTIGESQ